MPPIEGVTFLWIFLLPGISTKFFASEYLMIIGKIINETRNEVTHAANNTAISLANFSKFKNSWMNRRHGAGRQIEGRGSSSRRNRRKQVPCAIVAMIQKA
jgi:hypothetical protein